MARRKRITTTEFLASLEKDEKYQAMRRKQEEALRIVSERLDEAEKPLLRDLRATPGDSELTSVWDLVNTRRRYPELVPVLLAHLERDYPARILEGIARALAVREAKIGWAQLVRRYSEIADDGDAFSDANQFKFALHLAIAAAADESALDDLIRLAIDRRHVGHRVRFVYALDRMDTPRARATFEELRKEKDLAQAFKHLDELRRRRKHR